MVGEGQGPVGGNHQNVMNVRQLDEVSRQIALVHGGLARLDRLETPKNELDGQFSVGTQGRLLLRDEASVSPNIDAAQNDQQQNCRADRHLYCNRALRLQLDPFYALKGREAPRKTGHCQDDPLGHAPAGTPAQGGSALRWRRWAAAKT
jgi:hypothetical protein